MLFEFESAESFDPWGVNDVGPFRHFRHSEHLGECRGVHSGIMDAGYLCCGEFRSRYYVVYKSRFSYTGVT